MFERYSGHSDILLLTLLLGYKINPNGMCAGISTMAMQAILAKKVQEFEERRDRIIKITSKTVEKHPISINTSHDYLEILDTLLKENKEVHDILLNQLQEILRDEINIDKETDIPAFFDGIALHQDAKNFNEIISTKNRGQHFRTEILPLTSPIALDKDGIHEFTPICYSFNKQELTDFLQEIQSEVFSKSTGSKSMIISGSVSSGFGGHTITIGYDPEKEEWYFINSNQPIIYTKDHNHIAKLIMDVYQYKGDAYLAIDIYGLQSEKDLLEMPLKGMETKLIENLKTNPTKLTTVDSRGDSLLMLATKSNYQNWVTYFLDANTNPNQVDKNGYHLLSYALANRDLTIINLLLKHGVDPNITMVPNKSHYVPIWYGISTGDVEIVATLLIHGADPNKVINEFDFTPMHLAAQLDKQNYMVIFDLLIQYGGDIDKKNKLGISSLDKLTSDEDRNIVQMIAEKHAEKMVKMIEWYIKMTQWELKWPGGQEIKIDNKIITVPTYVKQQWDQIERAKADEINFRDALKEVIRIGKEVPESSFRQEKTIRYYSMFKASSYTIEK